jgi:hypothetical protein
MINNIEINGQQVINIDSDSQRISVFNWKILSFGTWDIVSESYINIPTKIHLYVSASNFPTDYIPEYKLEVGYHTYNWDSFYKTEAFTMPSNYKEGDCVKITIPFDLSESPIREIQDIYIEKFGTFDLNIHELYFCDDDGNIIISIYEDTPS